MSLLSFLTKTELPKEHDALVGREEKIFEPSSHFVNKNIYPINSSIFEKVYFGMVSQKIQHTKRSALVEQLIMKL